MPVGVTNLELINFFNGIYNNGLSVPGLTKSVQVPFRYFITFTPSLFFLDPAKKQLYSDIGPMPQIRSWHCRSISIPNYQFQKEVQYYGPVPRSLARLEYDGFEVTLDLEEDNNGTIGNFVNWLQRSIIDQNTGYYRAPDAYKIPMILVVAEDEIGMPLGIYTLHQSYYLSCSPIKLDYGSSEQVIYSLTLNCDIINSFFPQAWSVTRGVGKLLGV